MAVITNKKNISKKRKTQKGGSGSFKGKPPGGISNPKPEPATKSRKTSMVPAQRVIAQVEELRQKAAALAQQRRAHAALVQQRIAAMAELGLVPRRGARRQPVLTSQQKEIRNLMIKQLAESQSSITNPKPKPLPVNVQQMLNRLLPVPSHTPGQRQRER